jgi:hypothetical protein
MAMRGETETLAGSECLMTGTWAPLPALSSQQRRMVLGTPNFAFPDLTENWLHFGTVYIIHLFFGNTLWRNLSPLAGA